MPSRKETTAIAFQFNPPDACAPQSVLLAVPPVPDADLDGRAACIACWSRRSTSRSCARSTAEALGEIGHYLPALFFAFNANDEVVSTDFAPLTR